MNNTTELIQNVLPHSEGNKFRITLVVVYIVVTLATYFGNNLILVSLRKFTRRLKGTPYILLGNLAVSDLLLAVGLTLYLIGILSVSLKSSKYFCVIKIVVIGISLSTSGKLLFFMSLDRFCAIMFPLRHLARSRNSRYKKIKLAVVWLLSAIAVCLPISFKVSSSEFTEECQLGKIVPEISAVIGSVGIVLQIIISVILCLVVMWRLKTSIHSKQKYKKIILKCGLLIKVYIVLIICWIPFVLTTLFIATSNDKQRYMSVREYTILPVLMDSSINWIVYGLANRKMRHAFRNVLLCKTVQERHAVVYTPANSTDKIIDITDKVNKHEEPDGTRE